ncbi:hypothetical protein [Bradyrhizobium sp. USDA 4454]
MTTTKHAKRFASSSRYSMSQTALTQTPHPATWALPRSRMPEGAIAMIICSCNVLSDHDVRDGADDAFHLVIPSMHGYGFSGKLPNALSSPCPGRRMCRHSPCAVAQDIRRHWPIQQLADQRHAVSLAPSATESPPEVVHQEVSVSLGIVGTLDGVRMTRGSPGFRVRAGFDSGRGDCRNRKGIGACLLPGFLSANTARHPAGICAGIGSNRRQNCFQIQMVMALGNYRPGHHGKNLNDNNNLSRWFDSGFPRKTVATD